MASPFTVTSVSNYNSNPPPDDGSQVASNRVQWSTGKQKLADPIKTAFDSSETNTSTAFGKVMGGAGITTTAVSYTITASDQGKFVKGTVAGITITTPDATAVGSPFVCIVVNASTGDITLDGNGSQNVDGVASITLHAGTGVIINTDGSNWFTGGQNFVLSSIAQAGTGITFNTGTSPPTIVATVSPPLVPNYISGLTLSTAGSSSTMSIAAGVANDTTNATLMQLASAISKTTASWAVGTGNGGLDTGSIANSTWYHFFEIYRADTGVVDVLFSLSSTTPTMPTSYTLFRRIGSGKTDSSAHWTRFYQTGKEFLWDVPTEDVNLSGSTPSGLLTLNVPSGFSVVAHMNMNMRSSVVGGNVLLHSPLTANQTQNTPSGNVTAIASVAGVDQFYQVNVITNTSQQIRASSNGTGSITFSLVTYGWTDLSLGI